MAVNVIRKIDSLGRIVIPKGIRDQMRLMEGSEVELAVNGDLVTLRPVIRSEDERYRIAREVLEELGEKVPEKLKLKR